MMQFVDDQPRAGQDPGEALQRRLEEGRSKRANHEDHPAADDGPISQSHTSPMPWPRVLLGL